MDSASSPPSFGRQSQLIVGREREQATLRGALDEMLVGHGSLVLISGEAGIGKTTLVEWLAAEAEQRDALVLRGGCYDLSVTPPYGPWLELFQRFRPDERLPQLPSYLNDAAALAQIGSQEGLFTRTVEFFAELAEQQPAVLLLEDLHWADPASVDFLRYFARSVPAHRLLLVATHRRDELNRQHPLAINLPLLVREAGAERIEVRRLNDAATRTLIQGRYTLAGDDQQRLERYLEARAEGNPLFAGELLRTLEEHDILQPEDGRWQLGELADVSVPPLLKQVIEGRLARLGDEIRLYLAQASVIGQDVPLNLWSTVTGLPETALLEVMEYAIDARLLDPTDHGARFVHALIRDAIYDSVLPVRRRVWHRQIGEALLDRPNPDADQLAHHFQQGGDDRATEWLIQAGERAERAYAWLTAANRFEAAANLMANDPSASQERTILLNRVAMWRRYADPALALAMLEEVLRLAKAARRPCSDGL